MDPRPGNLRIGELGRRVGVSPELLRAWERRYGVLQPTRSAGGFRLYSVEDEQRIGAMQRLLAAGLSAAEAARSALEAGPTGDSPPGDRPAGEMLTADLAGARANLQSALERFDEAGAHAVLDRALATFATGTVLVEVVLPVIRSLGDGWAEGRNSIAQEHFASNLLRGRMLGLARGWGNGRGPVALLACLPGELHDLPLVLFGIALREAGWRISFLGADTPLETIEAVAAELQPRSVVLTAVTAERFEAVATELATLARGLPVAIGGAGARPELATRVGAVLLEGDPVTAAAAFARDLAA